MDAMRKILSVFIIAIIATAAFAQSPTPEQTYKMNADALKMVLDYKAQANMNKPRRFVRLFANTVLGKLDSAPQKALSRISQFIRSCRPVFTFDEITGVPKVTIDVAPAEEENTLKEIFDYLASSEKRCYIAIDEFQQITEYDEKGVEALLRSYIQFLPNVNFIFAGSRKHVMQEMFTSSISNSLCSSIILSKISLNPSV